MIDKLKNKLATQAKNPQLEMMAAQIIDICGQDTYSVELVLEDLETKTLDDLSRSFKGFADKQPRNGNCACITPLQSDILIREFFGIEKKPPTLTVISTKKPRQSAKTNFTDNIMDLFE